jgi:hypothetical protein
MRFNIIGISEHKRWRISENRLLQVTEKLDNIMFINYTYVGIKLKKISVDEH